MIHGVLNVFAEPNALLADVMSRGASAAADVGLHVCPTPRIALTPSCGRYFRPLARALAGVIPPISRDGGGIREDYEYHDDDGLSRKSTKQIRDARGILN